jgi:hypothetical protein
MPRGCKKDKEDRLNQLSFETPACQNMSLGAAEELELTLQSWQNNVKEGTGLCK